MLIDISVLARGDAGTGIQRVTKCLLDAMLAAPPPGYQVRTVRASRWRSYRYANGQGSSTSVQVQSGDIFLGLDLASHILPRHRLQLIGWQVAGVKLCVVMYDLLPILHRHWFTRRNASAYAAWIRMVAAQADSVACISRTVANQFRSWLDSRGFRPESSPEVGWFHPGAQHPRVTAGLRHDTSTERAMSHPFVLMVGTIEPRKGYVQALDAFDHLWRAGEMVRLVIVGRPGWGVDALLERLRSHRERGERLHWFEAAADHTLHALYKGASGVLIASEAEGFGLPILEAATYHKPLLLRDLPVFREIAGPGAAYFRGSTAPQFAREVSNWLRAIEVGSATDSSTIPVQSWSDSARQLVEQLAH
jgi:glycosyltransferase involved in cell wall biosynthesis